MATKFFDILLSYANAILPWFLLGMIFAFVVERLINPQYIRKYFSKFSFTRMLMASFFGMISPLSIMSFLPIAGQFVKQGANPALLFSFFIAERAYDLQSFFIISSLFGVRFAMLNAIAIFLSSVTAAFALQNEKMTFINKKTKKYSFWAKQSKLLITVLVGITIGALLRMSVPEFLFKTYTGTPFSGLIGGVIVGFSVYFGPILGNYPVAKAFADLGMSQMGVLGFMTISPIFNFIVILLFSTFTGIKKTIKPILAYTFTATCLSILFSYFL